MKNIQFWVFEMNYAVQAKLSILVESLHIVE